MNQKDHELKECIENLVLCDRDEPILDKLENARNSVEEFAELAFPGALQMVDDMGKALLCILADRADREMSSAARKPTEWDMEMSYEIKRAKRIIVRPPKVEHHGIETAEGMIGGENA